MRRTFWIVVAIVFIVANTAMIARGAVEGKAINCAVWSLMSVMWGVVLCKECSDA